MNGEAKGAHFLEYGKINKSRLKHVILLTDGLFWPDRDVPSDQSYWGYIARRILGVEQYAHELLEVEEADPECLTYARFKNPMIKQAWCFTLTTPKWSIDKALMT